MRKLFAAALAAITAFSSVEAGAASGTTAPRMQVAQYEGRDHRSDRDAFRDRRYWDRRKGPNYYDRYYGDERRDNDAAIALGFLGFILGAAIIGSARDRDRAQERLEDREWIASCARRYRTFDARTGTYLGNDGYRRYCR